MSAPDQQQKPQGEQKRLQRLLEFLNRDAAEEGLSKAERDYRRGLRYEEIRRRLIRLFAWRGSPYPELLADRTFDRVMAKVDSSEWEEIKNPAFYVCGVGRIIFLESLRESRTVEIPAAVDDPEEKERAARCLDRCMEQLLEPQERTLIVEYYRGERRTKIEHRRELAQRRNLSLNALRIECCRIRGRIQSCVRDCVTVMK